MKTAFVSAIAAALVVAGLSTLGWRAVAGGDLVKFRESYAEGVHYATVKRGIQSLIHSAHATSSAASPQQVTPRKKPGQVHRYEVCALLGTTY